MPSRRIVPALTLFSAVLLLTAMSCSGGRSGDRTGESSDRGARAALQGIEYGRLVDLYAWRRVREQDADRLDPRKRQPVLVARNILVHPLVREENPFGNARARYRFRPYDPKRGRRELIILWDDRFEADAFEAARTSATSRLPLVSPHFAFERGLPKAAPVVPRDATIRLRFDRSLGLEQEYFDATPGLVQVLRLAADPALVGASLAYEILPAAVYVEDGGKSLLVDFEVSGDEARSVRANPHGLPASLDSTNANIRIALPLEGRVTQRFRVRKDSNAQYNQVGLSGVAAIVRDFRSGHRGETGGGALPDFEAPRLVARRDMRILGIDRAARVLTIDKRGAKLVLRGRVPFVDGPYARGGGAPTGPRNAPQQRRIARGDVIWQDLEVGGQRLRVSAEVIENLDIESEEGQAELGRGGGGATARVRVQSLEARAPDGTVVRFRQDADCVAVVHYVHEVDLGASGDAGDAGRLAEFASFTPERSSTAEDVLPRASLRLHFSKQIDLESARSDENFVLANPLGSTREIIADRKAGTLAIVPSQAVDASGDATSVQLSPPLGFFHREGERETYYAHLFAGDAGLRDRSGEVLDLGAPSTRLDGVSLDFRIARDAPSNLVASFLARMQHPDENGTAEASSSPDYFGQFQIRDGRLYGLPGQRFSRVFDMRTSPAIRNDLSTRCSPGPSPLYRTAREPRGIVEPFAAEGSRLQQTYREVDFALSYRDETELEIDVEAMHWAPLITRTPSKLTYDLFDRVSMTLNHAEKRPYVRVLPNCLIELGTALSGLQANFESNYLDGAARVTVVEDTSYTINPNEAFAAATGTTMISYPSFSKSFTWRDRRIMSIAPDGSVVGLGGSQNPDAATGRDRTRDVTSPHIPEQNADNSGTNARQDDDYRGDRAQDLGPYALPLLVDFSVWPDDAANGLAKADNIFQVASMLGFYNAGAPWTRVHSTGGFDSQRNLILVDPPNTVSAGGGWLYNGSFQAPPGDSHVPWAQAGFVRKHSVVTSGYLDTLAPGRNDIEGPPSWSGNKRGFPDLAGLQNGALRAGEFAVLMEPKPEAQPLGTAVELEWRACESFDGSDGVYARADDETAASRKNLLNPHFACEQYRYRASARVASSGLTPYVVDIDDLIDAQSGRAPRFLNYRMTLTNNNSVTPARVPYVSSLALVWRMR